LKCCEPELLGALRPVQVCRGITFMSLTEIVEFSERHGRMITNEEVGWAKTN
jgi:hypothetical protein